MSETVSIEGLRELDQSMEELTSAAQRGVLRRVLKAAAKPISEAAWAHAPVMKGNRKNHKAGRLRMSIHVGTKLSSRQRSQHRKISQNNKASAEVFIGPGTMPEATQQEFGNVHNDPQPFMRPAWDAHKHRALTIIRTQMEVEIRKAAERARRKAARLASKG